MQFGDGDNGPRRPVCAELLGVTVGNLDVIFHRACKAFKNNYPP